MGEMLFIELAKVFESLEKTTKRLEMTSILADFFKKTDASQVRKIVYLLQGRVAPAYKGLDIGMGEKLVEQAIAKATGYKQSEVEKAYLKKGDLGLVAEEMVSAKKQKSLISQDLTINHVFENFYKIASATGSGSQDLKVKLLTELLNNAKPLEARYIVRIPLDRLSLGIGDPTVLDALSVKEAGDKSLREVLEKAYNVCCDLGLVAETLYTKGVKGLEEIKMTPGVPVMPALCERLPSAQDIIKKLGKCAAEPKFDGFRMQAHKDGDKVWLFSRRQENMTNMFPEVVEAVRKQVKLEKAILDGEAIGYDEKTGEYLPFQKTMQRKRKYGIEEMLKENPLRLFVFDIIHDGKEVAGKPFKQRRKILEKAIAEGETIRLTDQIITDDAKELQEFFEDCISRGLEGIVAKDLNAPYTAGARKFAWIKLKRSYKGELSDTVDVVIVGYYYGKGARAKFGFGGFLAAVYDDDTGEFKTITRVGSGFTEEQMKELREMLEKIKVKEKPKNVDSLIKPDEWVTPKYVAEVMADEITKSPLHTCGRRKDEGYALRFPRMIGLKFDRAPEEATTVKEIIEMYKQQKRIKIGEEKAKQVNDLEQ